MGKIKSSSIELLHASAAVFRPGESVSGTVSLDVEGEIKINKVDISLVGKGLTKWSPFLKRPLDDDLSSEETYVNLFIALVKPPTDVLTAGIHKYPFHFRMPKEGLPSSFEGRYGAVRYWLRLHVDKKFPSFDHVDFKYLTVLANIDVNDSAFAGRQWYRNKKTMSKVLGLGDAGTVILRASLDRKAYCPGEQIKISLEAKNESTKNCGVVKASLRQTVDYSAGVDTNSVETMMRVYTGSGALVAGKTIEWNNQSLTVAAMPPSTVERTCHIIKVSYHVLVEVEVSMGFNLPTVIPVTIGTVPLGVSISKEPTLTTSKTYKYSLSKFVFYKPCEVGVERFDESKGTFNKAAFTPRSAFACDPTPTSKQTTAAVSAAAAKVPATAAVSSAAKAPKTAAVSSAAKAPKTAAVSSAAKAPKTAAVSSVAKAPKTAAVSAAAKAPKTAAVSAAAKVPKTAAVSSAAKVLVRASGKNLVTRNTTPVATNASQSVETATAAAGVEKAEIAEVAANAVKVSKAAQEASVKSVSLPSGQDCATQQAPFEDQALALPRSDPDDRPPTYEEAIATEEVTQGQPEAQNPVPFHRAESSVVGSVLLLLFPAQSLQAVQQSFRRLAANMELHSGQVFATTEKISMIPSNPDTGGVLLYFPTKQASMSWLLNQTVTNPDLARNWWALVGENQLESLRPLDTGSFKAALVLLARIPLPGESALSAEEAQLNSATALFPEPEGTVNKAFSSSRFFFASGDWSGFPYRESEPYCFQVVQFQTPEECEAYKKTVERTINNSRNQMLHSLSTADLHLFRN